MNLTQSQREAVESRGHSLLVSASAGSGKTEVLARRCVSLIADEQRPCDVQRMLVVTFTRAAAAELRHRIGRMLSERAAQTSSRDLQRHLRRQVMLIDAAEIGTIDAWCGRLVREHFVDAGVDPAFSMLGEQEALLLRRQTLDELFDDVYAGRGELAAPLADWIARNRTADDDFLRKMTAALHAFNERLISPALWHAAQLRRHTLDDGSHTETAAKLLADALASECAFQRQQLAALLQQLPADDANAPGLRRYEADLGEWTDRLTNTPDSVSQVAADIEAWKPHEGRRPKDAPKTPLLDQIAKQWHDKRLKKRAAHKTVETILAHADATSALAATLLQLTSEYGRRLEDAKRDRAAYEFADVQRMALRLLIDDAGVSAPPTAIAEKLRGRYEHVLVDEYQDTSPIQDTMLCSVTRDQPGRTNRFMVGDVKQSIYGFREAEPQLFVEQMRAFDDSTEEGQTIWLSANFRSHAALLDGLNTLFAQIFDPQLGGSDYGEREKLCARRDEIPNPTLDNAARVHVQILEKEKRSELSAASSSQDGSEQDSETGGESDETALRERIEREASLAAEQINAMLREGVRVPRRRPNGGLTLEPLRLADIAILLRSARVNALRTAEILRAAGIPCVTSGREPLLKSIEVADVRAILDLLVNRSGDVAMAAFLRGPVVQLSADEMLEIRNANPDGDYAPAVEAYAASGPDAELTAKLRAALKQLDEWTIAARELELPALLRRIYHDGALELFVRGRRGGPHRVQMLRALQRFAEDFAGRSGQGVSEFIEFLDELDRRDIETALPVSAGQDVVRIMTIHGAKGLEFPIVFLLNAGAAFSKRPRGGELRCDVQVGVGLRFLDYPARTELISPEYHVLKLVEADEELQEEMRLLYVAATRAREKLFVIGHLKKGAWDEIQHTCDMLAGRPPLPTLLAAGSALEWTLWGLEAGGGRILADDKPPVATVVTCDADSVTAASANTAEPHDAPQWNDEDDRWVARGERLLTTPIDARLSRLPAALSVSALKSLDARRLSESDERPAELLPHPGELRDPALSTGDRQASGTDVGTACHQFLQHADLTRLTTQDDVRGQLAEMRQTRRMSGEAADLTPIADIVWFAATPEGLELAAHADRCRREAPFTFALPVAQGSERTIIRGIIDCLIETDDALVILDYKTDRVRDEDDYQNRLRGYTRQLQLYAWAAAEIFARPVAAARLIYLCERRIESVAIERPPIDDLLSGDIGLYSA